MAGAGVDTNSAWLARHLERVGLRCRLHRSCPDEVEAIARALTQTRDDVDAVLVTGGLGPTVDDRTREGVARALGGVPLELDEASWGRIQALFARLGREAPASNRRQAELPRGARVLPNEVGTAPGFRVELAGAPVFVLPGVPREVRWMWRTHLEAELASLAPPGAARAAWTFRTVGISESALGELLDPLDAEEGVEVRYRVEEDRGTIEVTLLAAGAERLEDVRRRARERVAHHLCAEGEQTLPEAVVALLLGGGRTVATAESCTGGRVAAALTSVAGVSAAFEEGLVTYADEAKERLLGVPADLLAAEGAVSEPVARAMARGARERAGADLGLGVTGIAGPGGGSDEKPVGLVHLAVAAGPRGAEPTRVRHLRRVFPGDRERIQARATAAALDLLRRALGER